MEYCGGGSLQDIYHGKQGGRGGGGGGRGWSIVVEAPYRTSTTVSRGEKGGGGGWSIVVEAPYKTSTTVSRGEGVDYCSGGSLQDIYHGKQRGGGGLL